MNNIQDIDILSTSLKQLNVSNTRPLPLENDQVLRKYDNIRFKLKDNSEWKTATLIFRSGKASRKYKKTWKSKVDDGTMQSFDYERDAATFEHLPKSSASSATNPQTSAEEVLCSKTDLTELEHQTMKAKLIELENWK